MKYVIELDGDALAAFERILSAFGESPSEAAVRALRSLERQIRYGTDPAEWQAYLRRVHRPLAPASASIKPATAQSGEAEPTGGLARIDGPEAGEKPPVQPYPTDVDDVLTLTELHDTLTDTVQRVVDECARILITVDGVPVAGLIDVEDLRILEHLEGLADVGAYDEAKAAGDGSWVSNGEAQKLFERLIPEPPDEHPGTSRAT